MNHIKISPFDTNLKLHIHTDASAAGLGFVLSQPLEDDKEDMYRLKRKIVTLGSAGLTPAQTRYSAVELEALAIFYAVSKLDYFTRYAPLVEVFTDSKTCVDYLNMDLSKIKNSRILTIMEKLRSYNIKARHVGGETNFLPDRLIFLTTQFPITILPG